jgi:predicted transcriptional regulator
MLIQPIRIDKNQYLKQVLYLLLLNQGYSLKKVIPVIATRLNVRVKAIKSFVNQLRREGFLVVSRNSYAFTPKGNLFAIAILSDELGGVVNVEN